MTPLGHELARLPLDPTLGRMLLQARHEGALEEMLVIAAGLSVPDPREWPEDAREAANNAHRAFVEPESDFLTLLEDVARVAGGEHRATRCAGSPRPTIFRKAACASGATSIASSPIR